MGDRFAGKYLGLFHRGKNSGALLPMKKEVKW